MSNANTLERAPNGPHGARAFWILLVLLGTLVVAAPAYRVSHQVRHQGTFIHGWPVQIMRSADDASTALIDREGSFGFMVNISPIQGYYYDFKLLGLVIGCAISATVIAIGRFWWRQKHRFWALIWSVIILVMAAFILPGQPIPATPEDEQYMASRDWDVEPFKQYRRSFGWPLEYMRSPDFPPSPEWTYRDWIYDVLVYLPYWMEPRAWPIQQHIFQLNLLYLIIDLAIGMLIIWGLNKITKLSFFRPPNTEKKHRFSFSFRGLLTIVALLAFALSWYQTHAIDHFNLKACLEQKIASVNQPWTNLEYQGPVWLRRLVGNDMYLYFCFHSNTLGITTITTSNNLNMFGITALGEGDELKRKLRLIGGCRRTEVVNFYGTPPVEFLQTLNTLPKLKVLHLQNLGVFDRPRRNVGVTPDEIAALSDCSNLEVLTMTGGNLQVDDLKQLSRLPRLECLEFQGNLIQIDDLSALEQFPSLKAVTLNVAASESEMQEFQRDHPNLIIDWDRLFEDFDSTLIEAHFERVAKCVVWTDEESCRCEDLKAEHLVFLQDTTLKRYLNQIQSLTIHVVCDAPLQGFRNVRNSAGNHDGSRLPTVAHQLAASRT